MNHTTLLDAALAYARRGWCIIPIRHKPNTDGKQPAVPWKAYQALRPTDGELRGWFADGRPVDGLAVILGDVSGGLVCRDFDDLATYETWAGVQAKLARSLPTVATARGRHVYFRSTWRGFVDLGDGELRGDSKHYCILPPSRHPSGTIYHWLVPWPDGDLAPIDPWKSGFLSETESTERTEKTEETEKLSNEDAAEPCPGLSVLSVSRPAQSNLDDLIKAAIQDTLPKSIGQRNRAIFELARALKAIPALADTPVADLRDFVRQWHALALPIVGTKAFDETWADFVAAWPRVRFPRGQERMALIVQRADSLPQPNVAERYDAPETRRLIAICRELQCTSGDGPFFMSCRVAAGLLGLDQATAWRRLGMLVVDGVLVVVQKGKPGRATRFRYVGDETPKTDGPI